MENKSYLKEVLDIFMSDQKCDSDFIKKNNYYLQMDLIKQYTFEEIINILNAENFMHDLIESINSIKKEYLYSSYDHGVFHNERVLLYAYLLGKLNNIDSQSMKILLDAAKYHDIGRQDDLEDPNHGFLSSIMIDKVIENDEFYQNKENLKVLKAMIHHHSIDDEYLNKILSHYEIESNDKVITIMKILKDADGLDRVRLSVNYFFSSLDPRYLRLEQSKSLVKFSHQINEIYLSLEKNITMNVTK